MITIKTTFNNKEYECEDFIKETGGVSYFGTKIYSDGEYLGSLIGLSLPLNENDKEWFIEQVEEWLVENNKI